MIIIKQKNGENIERMLKRFKKKLDNVKTSKELKDRKEYIKPSVKKRKIKQKAIYIEKIKNNSDE